MTPSTPQPNQLARQAAEQEVSAFLVGDSHTDALLGSFVQSAIDTALAELKAERDELRKDKERLDWLEQYGAVDTLSNVPLGGRWAVWNSNRLSGSIYRDNSLRAAIDAALTKEASHD